MPYSTMDYSASILPTSSSVFHSVRQTTSWELPTTPVSRAEYAFDGRSVWQQTLNLSKEEKAELIRLLQENYLPENRVYRYNFFYDNCATRPRDKIEESIDGKVIYPASGKTVRYFPRYRTSILQRPSVGPLRHRPLHRQRSRPPHHATPNDVCPLLPDGCFRRRPNRP